MPKRQKSISVFDTYSKEKKKSLLHKKINRSDKPLTVGIVIGVFLTIITIILQCVAFFTPHWKEISPKTNSLYVDGVDALIRNEILVYFNSVHRFTRHSYGLFQRCEYILQNSSKLVQGHENILNIASNKEQKRCTKNFLPSYDDEQFNECHSLQYYRFCSKTNGKIFDIDKDYLRPTYDILSDPHKDIHPDSSLCACQYPRYVKACHIIGIFALIFLFVTVILYGIFPHFQDRHQRLKIKCFAVLFALFSMLFMITNILIVLNHLEFESIKYLITIERHYRSNQIYKLSQDTTAAMNQFISSINIQTGYSAKIAWLAFILSIIDGILIMLTCKIKYEGENISHLFTGISTNGSQQSDEIENEKNQISTTENTTDFQLPSHSPSLPPPPLPPLPSTNFIDNCDEQLETHSTPLRSCLKRSSQPRVFVEDEV